MTQYVKSILGTTDVHVCSIMSNSFLTPWIAACQAPLSMGFFQARMLEWVAISYSRGYS